MPAKVFIEFKVDRHTGAFPQMLGQGLKRVAMSVAAI